MKAKIYICRKYISLCHLVENTWLASFLMVKISWFFSACFHFISLASVIERFLFMKVTLTSIMQGRARDDVALWQNSRKNLLREKERVITLSSSDPEDRLLEMDRLDWLHEQQILCFLRYYLYCFLNVSFMLDPHFIVLLLKNPFFIFFCIHQQKILDSGKF